MSKRDLSAGIRARQRSAPFRPEEAPAYVAVEIPAALDGAIDEHVFRLNLVACDTGRAGITKRRFVEIALRDMVRRSLVEILERE